MNISPNTSLNFLFQIVPVPIENKTRYLKNWHITNYKWSNKRPKIKLKKLQHSKEQSGSVALNFKLDYYGS